MCDRAAPTVDAEPPLVRSRGPHCGQLYNAMERRAIAHGMDDEEALALGAAYKQALEREKHGGAIRLPAHLHAKFGPRK